jgi:hypothetical protein
MVTNKKRKPPKAKSYEQDLPGPDEISFIDVRTNELRHMKKGAFEDELKKIHDHLQNVLRDIEKLGNYTLKEIEFSVGVSAGFIIVTVQGGITIRYERNESPG